MRDVVQFHVPTAGSHRSTRLELAPEPTKCQVLEHRSIRGTVACDLNNEPRRQSGPVEHKLKALRERMQAAGSTRRENATIDVRPRGTRGPSTLAFSVQVQAADIIRRMPNGLGNVLNDGFSEEHALRFPKSRGRTGQTSVHIRPAGFLTARQ